MNRKRVVSHSWKDKGVVGGVGLTLLPGFDDRPLKGTASDRLRIRLVVESTWGGPRRLLFRRCRSYNPQIVVVRFWRGGGGEVGGGRCRMVWSTAGDLPRLQIYTRSVTGVRPVSVLLYTCLLTVPCGTVVAVLCNYFL